MMPRPTTPTTPCFLPFMQNPPDATTSIVDTATSSPTGARDESLFFRNRHSPIVAPPFRWSPGANHEAHVCCSVQCHARADADCIFDGACVGRGADRHETAVGDAGERSRHRGGRG